MRFQPIKVSRESSSVSQQQVNRHRSMLKTNGSLGHRRDEDGASSDEDTTNRGSSPSSSILAFKIEEPQARGGLDPLYYICYIYYIYYIRFGPTLLHLKRSRASSRGGRSQPEQLKSSSETKGGSFENSSTKASERSGPGRQAKQGPSDCFETKGSTCSSSSFFIINLPKSLIRGRGGGGAGEHGGAGLHPPRDQHKHERARG